MPCHVRPVQEQQLCFKGYCNLVVWFIQEIKRILQTLQDAKSQIEDCTLQIGFISWFEGCYFLPVQNLR